jgi:predicted nuclease of predicted toxin-antitoxin system
MPKTIRFHLDENVDPRVASGLRLHAIDVTVTAEAGLLAASDLDQLDYIAREDRVIITQDHDFLRLHSAGHSHPGIAFYQAGTRSIGQVIRGARLIWELLEPAEMQNRVEYL